MLERPAMIAATFGIAGTAAVAAVLISGILGDGGLAWIQSELPGAIGHLGHTTLRLLEAVAQAGAVAVPLAIAMRRWQRLETLLTPVLLVALSVPWVVITIALSMMIHLRPSADGAVILAALGCGSLLVGALAPRQQTRGARSGGVRRAVHKALWILVAVEILALSQGLGSQLRYYVLYWSPPLLLLYAGLLALVIAGTFGAGWVLSRPLPPFAARLAARPD